MKANTENVLDAVSTRWSSTVYPVIAIWVNMNYSVNMASSKIRQYLDDLERRAEAAVVREPLLPVLPTKSGWKDKRAALAAKRNWLSGQFDAAPNNIRWA